MEATHRELPRTYSIPRGEQRRALEPGWLAKLAFEVDPPVDGCSAEKMWVEIARRDGDEYAGVLTNQPRYLGTVARADEITFRAEHVAAVLRPNETKLGALVGVGVDILRDGVWPAWIARVESTSPHDSGWRVFSGKQTKRALAVRAISASTLFRAWAVTDSAIEGDADGVFRWDEDAVEYVRATALPAKLRAAAGKLGVLHEPMPDLELGAVITKRVLEEAPAVTQRIATKREGDSGWCVLVGDETQDELDDTENSTVASLGGLVRMYPYLERVLGETKLGMYAWNDKAFEWDFLPPPKRGR